jgi:hypothetical protein
MKIKTNYEAQVLVNPLLNNEIGKQINLKKDTIK